MSSNNRGLADFADWMDRILKVKVIMNPRNLIKIHKSAIFCPIFFSPFVITVITAFLIPKTFIMKEFMMIFLGADPEQLNMSPDQAQSQMQKWFAWVDELKQKNVYVEGRPLLPAAKTVKGKKPVITDGPFAEAKELVGGYFIVKAASLAEAAEMAKSCPDFELGGSVEVREVMAM